MTDCTAYPLTFSGFLALSDSERRKYQSYWDTFNRIQAFNTTVSTLRNAGDRTKTYYIYASYAEREAFTNGQMLHTRQYPSSSWATVPQD